MRGFTSLTADMTAEHATGLLNDYYDCVVPHIESRGGEVLKLIADGILAIFRVEDDEDSENGQESEALACANAYAAAVAGLRAVAERRRSCKRRDISGRQGGICQINYGKPQLSGDATSVWAIQHCEFQFSVSNNVLMSLKRGRQIEGDDGRASLHAR